MEDKIPLIHQLALVSWCSLVIVGEHIVQCYKHTVLKI